MRPSNSAAPSVLIVEDDDPLRAILNDEFSRAGFEVIQAADGEVALKMALQDNPSIILLDLNLPKLDGTSVLRELRHKGWDRKPPVIVTTNDDKSAAIFECLAAGAQDYFIKADTSIRELVDHAKARLHLA